MTTRPFSQGLEMSQMTLSGQDDNMQPSVATQEDLTEEHLSSRANSICEENQQIRTYVESSLKQLEKRRLMLINKKRIIEEQLAEYSQIHERQRQVSLELQMNLEEATERFQNELQLRPKLVEKLNHTSEVTNLFERHFAEGISVGLEMEKAKTNIGLKFKECHEKSKSENINTLKRNFMVEMEGKLEKCKKIREEIMVARDSNLREIQELANKSVEKSNNIIALKENMKQAIHKYQELSTTFNDTTVQNTTLNEEILKLQQELEEIRAVGNSDIQDLSLKINTEKNNNSNLNTKRTEREHCSNSLLTKLKELTNLSDQLETANQVTEMRNLELENKIDKIRKQNFDLTNEMQSLEGSIHKYEDVKSLNTFYNSKIYELKENMKNSEIQMEGKEESLKNLSNQFESLKQTLSSLEDNIYELSKDLELSMTAKEELAAKVLQNELLYEDERKNKILRNEDLENKNLEMSSKLNKILSDIEDTKNVNNKLQAEEEDMIISIKKNKDDALSCDEKLIDKKKELEEMSSKLTERISSKFKESKEYEELLDMAKPTLDELPVITTRKTYLEQAIQEQRDKYKKDKELMENNCNAKLQDMDKEMENYRSIMKGLLQAEVEATEKTKKDIKEIEQIKFKLEDENNNMKKTLNTLKAEEAKKRSTVVKVEKRLRAINNEAKVTHKDISDAISGKTNKVSETTNIFKRSHKLMTPTSSMDSLKKNVNQPPEKKVTVSTLPDFDSKVVNSQVGLNTKQWVESIPEDDEYEFSEI